MKSRSLLERIGIKLTIPAKIAIAVASAILVLWGLRWLGMKGIIGLAAGMAIMTILTVNRHTSPIIYFFIKSARGDVNLWDMVRGKHDDEYVDMTKEEKE